MGIIEACNLIHSYEYAGSENHSLDGISLTVDEGEFIALLGHNGCGKSTLAKHINALLNVQGGELTIAGLDARNEVNIWKIRRECGMVFQNPDNQFVSSVVAEDIAFGLENYGTPDREIQGKVKKALAAVGLPGFERKSPHMLSGGQKQRVAIAGVLAIDPDIIIFDEATAMLDPEGRQEVLSTIRRLHDEEHRTIIMISHYVEEAVFADRVILLQNGQVLAEGPPYDVLTNPNLLYRTGLTPHTAIRAYYDLQDAGIVLPFCPLTNEELVEAICQLK